MASNRKQSPQRAAARGATSGQGPRRLGNQAPPPARSAGAQRRADRARRSSSSKRIGWIAVAAVVIVAVVLVAVTLSGSSKPKTSTSANGVATGQDPALASAAYVDAVTTIPTSVYNSIGTAGQPVPFTVTKGQPALTRGGKPLFLYEGAEYCPYCAMMRYAMVAALSRFGTWSHLHQTTSGSSDGNVPTFTFYRSAYSSPYLTFQSYESLDRQEPTPAPLETIPGWATKLYTKYDGSETTGAAAAPFNASGSAGIPFLDLGNKYVSAGDPAAFSSLWPAGGPLHNGGPGRLAIAQGIRNPTTATGQYVHGALFVAQANYLSAGICSLTGNKPATVCSSPGVKAAAKAIAQAKPVA